MHDNDTFRLISPEQAVAIACALALVATVLFAVPEPDLRRGEIAVPCAATIAQYGPGERWSPPSSHPPTVCVSAVLGDRADVFTSPMARK